MKLGKIVGALTPLLASTGILGNSAQGVGQGLLGGLSPMLALLMQHKKNKGGGGGSTPAPAATPGTPPIVPPQAQAPAQAQGGMDPAQRQRLASMFLQFGGQMNSPFGPRY